MPTTEPAPPTSSSARGPRNSSYGRRPATVDDAFAVSVVLTTRDGDDAALARSLDSFHAQTIASWEVVSAEDAPRRAALRPWVLLLEAGDTLHPTMLARVRDLLAADPSLDAVHCGWTNVDDAGRPLSDDGCDAEGDLFDLLARRSGFPSCACVARRSHVEAIGGLASAGSGVANWRLWQRVARRGARFGRIADTLATHRVRPSASEEAELSTLDASLTTIAIGHAVDPEAGLAPDAPFVAGRLASPAQAVLEAVCVTAAALLARGHDAEGALARLPEGLVATDLAEAAARMTSSVPAALGQPLAAWRDRWEPLRPRLEQFLTALETRTRTPGLARAMAAEVQRRVLPYLIPAFPEPTAGTCIVPVEATQPIGDLSVDPSVERAHLVVSVEGSVLGVVELTVRDGAASADAVRDAIAGAFAWPILARCLAMHAEAERVHHERDRWRVLQAELWAAEPPWRASLAALIDRIAARVRGTDDGRSHGMPRPMVVEVGAPLPWLVFGVRNVAGELRVGGVRVATREIAVGRAGVVSGAGLHAALVEAGNIELCRLLVRDVLLGAPLAGPPLRERVERRRRGAAV